ncbi:hypothetical protein J6590_104080, partial [Homalodisca vitripennis]
MVEKRRSGLVREMFGIYTNSNFVCQHAMSGEDTTFSVGNVWFTIGCVDSLRVVAPR